MYRATFQSSLEDPWRFMDPIRVGPVPTRRPQPHYLIVERDGLPIARIDAYAEHPGPFVELIVWDRFVVIGWAAIVHLVNPITRAVCDIECDGYFSQLYALKDRLFIATATELICLDEKGNTLWRRGNLAVDGVRIFEPNDGVINGEGEWDPPGGWRPFQLSLVTGEPVSR